MKFNFKKIGSILASTAMLSSTVALAAAANFPAPYVTSAGGDVAVIHGGANAAYTDIVAVTDVTSYLASELARLTASGSTSSTLTVEGETAPLFASGTKLYINDTLNTVKSVVTKTELPTVLKDGTFSGNVDATFTQTILIGSNPKVTFARQPTSSVDPIYALTTSTTTGNIIYNASVSFNKAVNLTHANSKGQSLEMFGQSFTIGSATSDTSLVLLKSAEKLSLTNADPSSEVTIAGKTYTVELVSASTTSATIKVTDSDGASQSKEISEAASKKVQGLTIAVDTADANNFALTASIIAGAEKVTFTDGSSVTMGEDDTVVDGAIAYITGGPTATTKITLSVVAKDSDNDAILPGSIFTDPVFGSFKIDFAGLSIPDDSTTARENLEITPSGDDKIELKMTDKRGNEKSLQWARNLTTDMQLQLDSDGRNISVFESGAVYRGEWVVLGNQEEGRLLKVSTITNQTTSYTSDKVRFTDVFSGDTYDATLTAEGVGTVTIAGKVYDVNYYGANSISEDARYVRVNYPDSSGANSAVIYPTIMTSKGALVSFYEPTAISHVNWDGKSNTLTTLRFPDGDGFTDITFGAAGIANGTGTTVTCGSTTTFLNNLQAAGNVSNVGCAIGQLTYNLTATAANETTIRLNTPGTTTQLTDPALVIFEEKDDNTVYNALVVTLNSGTTSSNGLDVGDVYRTWLTPITSGSTNFRDSLSSDSDITKEADLFGTIVSLDSNTAGHKKAIISYPDEQVQVNIYAGTIASAVTGASSAGSGTVKELGAVSFTDSEVSAVSGKNLIVVGGSCVNTVAADLLGVSAKTCSEAFTAKTGIGSGQYLIETFARTGGKVATLVAGYNAGDTTTAAKALTTKKDFFVTTAGKKYTGTTSTDVTASVAATA